MSYYIVMTKGGYVYKMHKNCTSVSIDHEKYLVCKNKKFGSDKTLLLIPHSEVETIELVEEDE